MFPFFVRMIDVSRITAFTFLFFCSYERLMKIFQKVLESSVESQKGDYVSCMYLNIILFLSELCSTG